MRLFSPPWAARAIRSARWFLNLARAVGMQLTTFTQSDDEPFSVTLSDESFETYELDPPPYTIEVTKQELKQMYYDMVCIRYVAVELQICSDFASLIIAQTDGDGGRPFVQGEEDSWLLPSFDWTGGRGRRY